MLLARELLCKAWIRSATGTELRDDIIISANPPLSGLLESQQLKDKHRLKV